MKKLIDKFVKLVRGGVYKLVFLSKAGSSKLLVGTHKFVVEKFNFFFSRQFLVVLRTNLRSRFEQLVVGINKAGYWFEYQRPKWYLFHKWHGWVLLPKIYEQVRLWLYNKGIEYQIRYHEFIGNNLTRRLVRQWIINELALYYYGYFLGRLELVPTMVPDDVYIEGEEKIMQLFWGCWALFLWGIVECLFALRMLLIIIFLYPLSWLIDFIFHDIPQAFLENVWWKILTNIAYTILIEWPESYRRKSFRFFIFTVNTGKRMLSYFFIQRTFRSVVRWVRETYSDLHYKLFFIRPLTRIAKKMRFESFILDETQWKYARERSSAIWLLFIPFIKYRGVPLRKRLVWIADRFVSRGYMIFPVVLIKSIVVGFLVFILGWAISAQDYQYERIVSHYGWLRQAKKLGVYISHNHTYMSIILVLVLLHLFLLFFIIPMVFTRVLVQMRRKRSFRDDPVVWRIWNRGLELYLRVERIKEILCDIIVLLVLVSWYVGPFMVLYLRQWVMLEHILPRQPTVYYFTYWYQFWQRGYDKYMHWIEPHLMDLRRGCVFFFQSYYIRFEAMVIRIYTYLHDLIITLYEPGYELVTFYSKVYWVSHTTIYQWMEVKHPIEMALALFEYAPHWFHNLNITYFWGFAGSISGMYFFNRFWLRTVWYGSTSLQFEAIKLSFKFCFFHMYGLFFIIVSPILCRYEPATVQLLMEHIILSEWLVTG
jgi:hypothetical protein